MATMQGGRYVKSSASYFLHFFLILLVAIGTDPAEPEVTRPGVSADSNLQANLDPACIFIENGWSVADSRGAGEH